MTPDEDVLVQVTDLERLYPIRSTFGASLRSENKQFVRAVDGVNLEIRRREVLGIVGQSGCGKTTLGLMLALLERPTRGMISFEGVNISELVGSDLKSFRRKVQIVFQDPYDSLNPRHRVEDTVTEPLLVHDVGQSRVQRRQIVGETLERVGLQPVDKFIRKFPHELSGGERQRVAIARAIALNPLFIVADEPVSMLDVSVRAGLLNLMLDLKEELGVTYHFITHDLSVARYMCDRIAVMYFGRLVEVGPTEAVLHGPQHPYTRRLIDAVPIPDPSIKPLRPTSDTSLDTQDIIPEIHVDVSTDLVEIEAGHFVAHHPGLDAIG
jgi:peptide/nickel transport system ATP-binding protein